MPPLPCTIPPSDWCLVNASIHLCSHTGTDHSVKYLEPEVHTIFFFFTFLLSSVPAGQPVIPDCFTYHKFPPTHKHSSILGSSPATKCPLLSRLLIILPQLGPSPRALQSKRSRKAPPYDSTSNTNVWYRPLWRDFSSRMVTSHPPRTVLFGRHFGQYKFPPCTIPRWVCFKVFHNASFQAP